MKGWVSKRVFTMNAKMDIKGSVHNKWKDKYLRECSQWMKGRILKGVFTMNERTDLKGIVHNEWKDGY